MTGLLTITDSPLPLSHFLSYRRLQLVPNGTVEIEATFTQKEQQLDLYSVQLALESGLLIQTNAIAVSGPWFLLGRDVLRHFELILRSDGGIELYQIGRIA